VDFFRERFRVYDTGNEEGVFTEVAWIGGSKLVDEQLWFLMSVYFPASSVPLTWSA